MQAALASQDLLACDFGELDARLVHSTRVVRILCARPKGQSAERTQALVERALLLAAPSSAVQQQLVVDALVTLVGVLRARQLFERAYALADSHAMRSSELLFLRATLGFKHKGRVQGAVEDLSELCRRDPDSARYRAALTEALLVLERPPSHYDTLGVDAGASDAEIRRAFRLRSLEVHPDKQLDEQAKEAATRAFHSLCDAFGVLSDPMQRRHYDCALAVRRGQ